MHQSPLYRRVNTKARGVHHNTGGDYRHERNTKQALDVDTIRQSMHGKVHRGLDYTPLFRFLLSKVGTPWNDVHSEAAARLDRQEPIFWLVALQTHERQEYIRVGESSYYSGLYVDEAGLLQVVNPSLGPSSLPPMCSCCTHTFNGARFTQRYSAAAAFANRGSTSAT
jgi:hypothetical protein